MEFSDTSDASPQKRHKKHKHKKHKKKKLMHDDSDAFVEISTDIDRKKSFRIKMKKEDERRYTKLLFNFLANFCLIEFRFQVKLAKDMSKFG